MFHGVNISTQVVLRRTKYKVRPTLMLFGYQVVIVEPVLTTLSVLEAKTCEHIH